MATWDEDLVIMLRAEIGDLDESSYSDSRLRQILVYSAYSVYQRASFKNKYQISVNDITISPDPIATNDYDFSVLMVYKAACTVMTGEAKTKGGSSISIKDGPSYFDNRNAGTNMIELMKTTCETYNNMLTTYQLCGSSQEEGVSGLGEAVLGPYSPGSFLLNWTKNGHRSGDHRW